MNSINIKGICIGSGCPKICVPFMGATIEDYESNADELHSSSANAFVDIVEIRADYFKSLNNMNELNTLMKKMNETLADKVILFTIRSESEGGQKLDFGTPPIKDIISYVIENKLADIVDVELNQGDKVFEYLTELAKKNDVKIVASYHNFHETPSNGEIRNKLIKMQNCGADIAKIAVMPNNIHDVFTLMDAAATVKESGKTPIIAISMGGRGALSRVAGELYGSDVTFASMGESSAPGQLPVTQLKNIMNSLTAVIP
ncbi:MAG: type I 3-dehydroquinate dehydratase [Lachnospiraceae bacterium]|nr:type I 3-dehydroquinate dehydratase [Lachnospiraceae bacterium]